jgi:hypothetical protein
MKVIGVVVHQLENLLLPWRLEIFPCCHKLSRELGPHRLKQSTRRVAGPP